MLSALIAQIDKSYGEVDYYCVGDLIDGGRDPCGVVDLCVRRGIKAVLGNHEMWLHRYLATGSLHPFAFHSSMRGHTTLRSYGVHFAEKEIAEHDLAAVMPANHQEYILSTPVIRKIQVDGMTIWLTHAGIKAEDITRFRQTLRQQAAPEPENDEDLVMGLARNYPRAVVWGSPDLRANNLYAFEDSSLQVFGHVPVNDVAFQKGWVALNTGSSQRPPRLLSAVVFPSGAVEQVSVQSDKFMPGTFVNLNL
jgi:hypothetical protein